MEIVISTLRSAGDSSFRLDLDRTLPVSAITIQSADDHGCEVEVGLADEYRIPLGRVPPNGTLYMMLAPLFTRQMGRTRTRFNSLVEVGSVRQGAKWNSPLAGFAIS